MGTRCITRFYDEHDQEICCLYRQYDGHPEGHGAELERFLKDRPIINGIGAGQDMCFNGMNALAAQCIAFFVHPHQTGGFYVFPPGAGNEAFEYHVHGKVGDLQATVLYIAPYKVWEEEEDES